MTKFIKSVAAAAVLATSATGVQAATLSTDVDVQLPSIIALSCFDSVTVNVSASGLEAALSSGTTGLGATTVNTLAADLGADSHATVTGAGTTVDLNLNNVCAFRALVRSGASVTVSEAADPRLLNGTDFIDATGITLDTGNLSEDVTTGLGLGAPATPISVTVPLDLSDATTPGTYSKADLFTITVTAL